MITGLKQLGDPSDFINDTHLELMALSEVKRVKWAEAGVGVGVADEAPLIGFSTSTCYAMCIYFKAYFVLLITHFCLRHLLSLHTLLEQDELQPFIHFP